MGRLSSEELAAWVQASCEEQGVPFKVTDAEVVREVATVLGTGTGGAGPKRERRPAPPASD